MKDRAVINIHHAKTHLSSLLTKVAGGQEVIIAKAGTPLRN
jgi:antitoxin (DNA-binding transcriptional repressor) of toxin-antitoxin stability system